MANRFDPSAEQVSNWRVWLSARPASLHPVCERFPPWGLYRLKVGGQRVVVRSFADDGTLTVDITARYNFVIFERSVTGVLPDDLEPCDLPSCDEVLGVAIDMKDVAEAERERFFKKLRTIIKDDRVGQLG